jgi:hypothetical protein
MRTILIGSLTAMCLGLLATSGASAVPVNSAVIRDIAAANNLLSSIQHYRYGSYGGHWRYGSRGGRGGRGHWRYRSRGY